jgi:hypothetical protein
MRAKVRSKHSRTNSIVLFNTLNVAGQLYRRGESGFADRVRRVACPGRGAMDSVVRPGMPADMLVGPASIPVLSGRRRLLPTARRHTAM